MMISSKGRYALRVMLDLAERDNGSYLRLKDIAERLGIPRKYLESIMTELSKNDLVESAIGKTGGYRLKRAPAERLRDSLCRCPVYQGIVKSATVLTPAIHCRSG